MLKVLFWFYVFSRDCFCDVFCVKEDSLLWRISSHAHPDLRISVFPHFRFTSQSAFNSMVPAE